MGVFCADVFFREKYSKRKVFLVLSHLDILWIVDLECHFVSLALRCFENQWCLDHHLKSNTEPTSLYCLESIKLKKGASFIFSFSVDIFVLRVFDLQLAVGIPVVKAGQFVGCISVLTSMV